MFTATAQIESSVKRLHCPVIFSFIGFPGAGCQLRGSHKGGSGGEAAPTPISVSSLLFGGQGILGWPQQIFWWIAAGGEGGASAPLGPWQVTGYVVNLFWAFDSHQQEKKTLTFRGSSISHKGGHGELVVGKGFRAGDRGAWERPGGIDSRV